MNKNKLDALKEEFKLFESRVNELEKLRNTLNSLDSTGFEKEFRMIEKKLSSTKDIPQIKRLIKDLEFKIKGKQIKSKDKLAGLIKQVLECYENIDSWNYKRISKKYNSLKKEYDKLSAEEKKIFHDTFINLYKKIVNKYESGIRRP